VTNDVWPARQSSSCWQLTVAVETSGLTVRQQAIPDGQSAGKTQGRFAFRQPSESNLAGSMHCASGGDFVTQQTWPMSQISVPHAAGPASEPASPASGFGSANSQE